MCLGLEEFLMKSEKDGLRTMGVLLGAYDSLGAGGKEVEWCGKGLAVPTKQFTF